MRWGLLLGAYAIAEAALWATGRPLLSEQRGWRRGAVIAGGLALVAHVAVEGARIDAADRAARAWTFA